MKQKYAMKQQKRPHCGVCSHSILDQETGSATITAVGLIMLAVVLAATVASMSAVFNARVHAQSGADLAAVAGAQTMATSQAFRDSTAGCALASQVAGANHVHLSHCQAQGHDIVVHVSVPLGPWQVVAAARAGPLWE